jgi:hypothetical protein
VAPAAPAAPTAAPGSEVAAPAAATEEENNGDSSELFQTSSLLQFYLPTHLEATKRGYPILHTLLNLMAHGDLEPKRHWDAMIFG